MKFLNNLKIQHKCQECAFRSSSFFCGLSETALQTLQSLKVTNAYPRGATLFVEGQEASGVYMLCQGRIKLSTCSRDGKTIILRIAEPGEILGLSATVTDGLYESTAEVLEPCQINFISKRDFLRFLEQNAEVGLSAAKQLSFKYHVAYNQICSLGLSNPVAARLARLLLDWCPPANGNGSNGHGHGHGNGHGVRLKMTYTHEEIAEMIGTSRETVSRLLKDFKERELIRLKGSDLIIDDPGRLDAIIGTRARY